MQSHKGNRGLVLVLFWALALAAPHARQKRGNKDCCGVLKGRAKTLFKAYNNTTYEMDLPSNISLNFTGLPNCTFSNTMEACTAVTAFLKLFRQFKENRAQDVVLKHTTLNFLEDINQLVECRECLKDQKISCPDVNISYTQNASFTRQKMIYYYAFQQYQSCMANVAGLFEKKSL